MYAFLLNSFLTSVGKDEYINRNQRTFEVKSCSELYVFALSQRTEIVMGDLSLHSIIATTAENLNIEASKERLRITHKTYLMNN